MDKTQFVAIDFETTGKYPLSAEICEVALVRFDSDGSVLDSWESLVRPLRGMNSVAESIHGLSLDMLKEAPLFSEVLPQVLDFVGSSYLVGHNVAFDLAFLAYELDLMFGSDWVGQKLSGPHFCTSKISLGALPKLSSHRLKHLVEHFQLSEEPNHRALQDALTCKNVFLKLLEGVSSVEELIDVQGDDLELVEFSTLELAKRHPNLSAVVKSCQENRSLEIMYSKGSQKGKWRSLNPAGLVLKTKGESFLVATDPGQVQTKRFMLDKILDSKV